MPSSGNKIQVSLQLKKKFKKTSLHITWEQFSAFSQIAARNKEAKRFVIYTGNLVCCINNLKYYVLYDLGTYYITMKVFTFYL